MDRIDHRQELRYICRLLPTREQRKSLSKHLKYLNDEIIERNERNEATKVMQATFDCLMQTLELLDAIRDVKVAMNGGKNDD